MLFACSYECVCFMFFHTFGDSLISVYRSRIIYVYVFICNAKSERLAFIFCPRRARVLETKRFRQYPTQRVPGVLKEVFRLVLLFGWKLKLLWLVLKFLSR